MHQYVEMMSPEVGQKLFLPEAPQARIATGTPLDLSVAPFNYKRFQLHALLWSRMLHPGGVYEMRPRYKDRSGMWGFNMYWIKDDVQVGLWNWQGSITGHIKSSSTKPIDGTGPANQLRAALGLHL